MYKKS